MTSTQFCLMMLTDDEVTSLRFGFSNSLQSGILSFVSAVIADLAQKSKYSARSKTDDATEDGEMDGS